jgi:hypothetical protein
VATVKSIDTEVHDSPVIKPYKLPNDIRDNQLAIEPELIVDTTRGTLGYIVAQINGFSPLPASTFA